MTKVCYNCLADVGRNLERHEDLGYKGPINKKNLTPHKCYYKILERFEDPENNYTKVVVQARPPSFTNVADPTLVAALVELSDSIRLLTLAQLASNEIERNEIRSKVRLD
jgi:hypothetical protein